MATRGYSFTGDIAIDDVDFQDCTLPAPAPYCFNFEFSCWKTRACISYDHVCDFTDDCGDGSDEQNCPWLHSPFRYG